MIFDTEYVCFSFGKKAFETMQTALLRPQRTGQMHNSVWVIAHARHTKGNTDLQ